MTNTPQSFAPNGGKPLLCALAVLGLAAALPLQGAQRPISDFLSAQGTYCLKFDPNQTDCSLFVPPQPNVGGWVDPKTAVFMLVDYPGLADAPALMGGALGTTMQGSITEVPLADGRAEVSVILRTKNALTWASDVSSDFPGPVLFGHTLAEVMAGATPALGESLLQLTFKNTAPGAPLPDLIQLTFDPQPGQEIEFESFQVRATGSLPNGAPARLEMRQTGLIGLQSAVNPNSRVALDAFPAEKIVIQATGK